MTRELSPRRKLAIWLLSAAASWCAFIGAAVLLRTAFNFIVEFLP
ncbi:hypothetical protein ACRAQ6_14115 [Erythrobacter sp. HA6-11]